MTRPTPVVPRDWLRRASLLGAAVLAVCGILVLAGWGEWIDWQGEVRPGSAPMPPDLALGLAVLAIVLLALDARIRSAAWLALLPAAMGLSPFAEQAFGWTSPFTELLEHGRAAIGAASPAAMTRLQALAL